MVVVVLFALTGFWRLFTLVLNDASTIDNKNARLAMNVFDAAYECETRA